MVIFKIFSFSSIWEHEICYDVDRYGGQRLVLFILIGILKKLLLQNITHLK